MSNSAFSVQQLIADDTFLAYVLRTDSEAIEYWENWIVQHPEQHVTVEEATRMMQWMMMKQEPVADSLIEEEALKLTSRLTASPGIHLPFEQPIRRLEWWTWQRVAASFLLLIMAAVAGWFLLSQPDAVLTYQTGADESKMLLLPDSSIVFLGENSSLRYAKDWQTQAFREVWLEGEAYFHVKPQSTPGGAKFQVHASHAIVEVLGTRFSVWNRNQKPRVILNTGKVKIQVDSNPEVKPVFMQPGEMVEWEANGTRLAKTKVALQKYPPQKGNKIVFEQTPVREIILVIEEYYGLKVQLQNKSIADLKITGTLPTNNEASFLKALSVTLNVVIVRQSENQLLFKYNR